jgi:vacuolar-type H+-ATPase subunit H
MSGEITGSVEALEVEAEKILAEARMRANKILVGAKEEARRMLSSQLPLGAAETECDKIVSKARAEADKIIRDSETIAAEINMNADKKTKEITERVVSIVRGKS